MKEIGRRIFYDIETGNIILNTGQRRGYVKETIPEDNIKRYKVLQELDENSFDYIELDYGEYDEDFSISNGYRVNPETKELEFSYPDPNYDDEEEPEEEDYRKPLSDQIEELKNENESYEEAIMEIADKQSNDSEEFEEALMEIASQLKGDE